MALNFPRPLRVAEEEARYINTTVNVVPRDWELLVTYPSGYQETVRAEGHNTTISLSYQPARGPQTPFAPPNRVVVEIPRQLGGSITLADGFMVQTLSGPLPESRVPPPLGFRIPDGANNLMVEATYSGNGTGDAYRPSVGIGGAGGSIPRGGGGAIGGAGGGGSGRTTVGGAGRGAAAGGGGGGGAGDVTNHHVGVVRDLEYPRGHLGTIQGMTVRSNTDSQFANSSFLTEVGIIDLLKNLELRTKLDISGTDLTVMTQLVLCRDGKEELVISQDEDSVDLTELIENLE